MKAFKLDNYDFELNVMDGIIEIYCVNTDMLGTAEIIAGQQVYEIEIPMGPSFLVKSYVSSPANGGKFCYMVSQQQERKLCFAS